MATNDPPDDPHLFSFDLDLAIRDQVIDALDKSPLLSLTKGVGPKLSGIYALYWKGELVYIGKAAKELTKSKRDLRARLNEHVGKTKAVAASIGISTRLQTKVLMGLQFAP